MLAPLIILFSILTAMMFDKISLKKRNTFTIIFLSIIIIQNLSFDRNKLYNLFSHTNLEDLLNYEVSRSNIDEYNIEKILTILDKDSKVDGPKQHDFFLENESIQFCYFSVFGYSLEALKPVVKPLIFNHHVIWTIKDEFSNDQNFNQTMNVYKGDPFFERNGNLNFINPSCYLNPEENNCKENFLFKATNKEELTKFLNYKPFEFKQLKLQVFFNYLSLITFIFTLISFFYFLIAIKKTPSKKI
jgi:hypothetical protein